MYIFNQDFIIYRPRGKCILESDERRQLVGGARLDKGVWRKKTTHGAKTVNSKEGRLHPQRGWPAVSPARGMWETCPGAEKCFKILVSTKGPDHGKWPSVLWG